MLFKLEGLGIQEQTDNPFGIKLSGSDVDLNDWLSTLFHDILFNYDSDTIRTSKTQSTEKSKSGID